MGFQTNRAGLSILYAALLLGWMIGTTAQAAVTYSVASSVDSGNSLTSLQVGDRVTFDITIRSDGEPIYGVGASAYGYSSVLSFDSGFTNPTVLSQLCVPAAGCFGGLDQSGLGGGVQVGLLGGPDESVRFTNAISLVPTTGTGSFDLGVATGFAGDAQVRLVFNATNEGDAVISFGTNRDYADATVFEGGETRNTPIWRERISVRGASAVPEPGAALLMSSGLLVAAFRLRIRRMA